jgi:hypothetical protein
VYLQQWDAEYWDVVFTPNGDDDWAYSRKEFSGIADFAEGSADANMTVRVGPLRSLRVLYENGYELKTHSRDGWIAPAAKEGITWYWSLSAPPPTTVVLMPGPVAQGSFWEDKDSEAVERAMIAAAAYFTQAGAAT